MEKGCECIHDGPGLLDADNPNYSMDTQGILNLHVGKEYDQMRVQTPKGA
jgi:hypothetical protein